MQTLLNSGTLVAKFLALPAQAMLAGQLLAVMTIARLPVLVFQSLQAVYVSRLAGRWHLHDVRGVRRLLACWLCSRVYSRPCWWPGQRSSVLVTKLIFGPEYVIDQSTGVLVALGVGVYLVAL